MQYPDKFSNNKIKKMALKVVDFKPKSKSVNVLCTSTVQLYNTKEYNKFIKTGYPTYSYLVNNPSERENVRGKIYIKLNDKDYPFGNQSIPMQPYAFYRQPGIYSTVPFELAIDLKASPSEAKIYNVSGIHWGKSVPKCWLETIYKDKVKKYALKAKGGLSSPNPYTKSTVTDKDGYSFIRVTIPKNFDPQTSSESFRFVINAGKGLDTRRAYIK